MMLMEKNKAPTPKSRIKLPEKYPVIKTMSCCVDTRRLDDIEGFGCRRLCV